MHGFIVMILLSLDFDVICPPKPYGLAFDTIGGTCICNDDGGECPCKAGECNCTDCPSRVEPAAIRRTVTRPVTTRYYYQPYTIYGDCPSCRRR